VPPLRIQCWSGPRNVSTALMYAFASRADTRVVDEPLYAHYLRVTGAQHPGREDVLASQDPDGERVVRDLVLGPCDRPVLFLKQMAHHLVDLDRSFLAHTRNVLLVRDPREMLPSLARSLGEPRLSDTGLERQVELLEHLDSLGRSPPVLDARELLLDPPGVLAELCARLEIPFDAAMLSWPAGGRSEDGVWARHWYAGVHRSRGFEPYRPPREPFPERLEPLLDHCRPLYERLAERAIRAGGTR
jgi:hypothetical protein